MKKKILTKILSLSFLLSILAPMPVNATETVAPAEAVILEDTTEEVVVSESENMLPSEEEISTEENIDTGSVKNVLEESLDDTQDAKANESYEEEVVEEETEAETEEDDISDVPVATADNFVTFEGEFVSATDEQTYQLAIDFTTMDSAALCVVRTGYTDADVYMYDENGTQVKRTATFQKGAKNWCYLDKPSEDATVCNYTITVKTYYGKINTGNNTYRVMVGEKSDAEEMMSGPENAVLLTTYYEDDLNFENAPYTPNHFGYWYRFSHRADDVVTLLIDKKSSVRFKIHEIDDVEGSVYNSEEDPNSHRTRFTGTWSYVEKVRTREGLNLVWGRDYYLEVYNINPNNSTDVIKEKILTAVGDPVMKSGSTTVYPSQRVSLSTSRYNTISFNVNDSSTPNTAQVTNIRMYGTVMSKIQNWRAVPPGGSWATSSTHVNQIKFDYAHGSSLNKNARGTWQAGFKASSSSNGTSFTPYFTIGYYYEYGD